jgi:hypothetical protein
MSNNNNDNNNNNNRIKRKIGEARKPLKKAMG